MGNRKESLEAGDYDSGELFKMILISILIIVVVSGVVYLGYKFVLPKYANTDNITSNTTGTNYLENYTDNDETDTTVLSTDDINIVTVTIENVTANVARSPDGIYYFSKQEKVTNEICYINNNKRDCEDMTNTVCQTNECFKEVETVIECFINREKVDCPD